MGSEWFDVVEIGSGVCRSQLHKGIDGSWRFYIFGKLVSAPSPSLRFNIIVSSIIIENKINVGFTLHMNIRRSLP